MPNGFKNWCATLQVEDGVDGEAMLGEMFTKGDLRYICGQLECGTHLHLQFYVQRQKQTSLLQMKRQVNDKAHWEPCRATVAQNIAYVTKEETRVAGPWAFGTPCTTGQRTDLDRVAEMVDMGASLRSVAIECKTTFIRYHKGIKAYHDMINSRGPRVMGPDGPEVWVFWGASGTGKSRDAFSRWPDAYRKMTTDKWWDGYNGQETVILDDFKGASMRLHDFQTLIDWYPLQVETKGSTVEMSATRFVFTSNKHPSEWYSPESDPEGTVMRRIKEFCERFGRLKHYVALTSEGTFE